MINTFYKDYPKKPKAISATLESVLLMVKSRVKLPLKQKQRLHTKDTIKHIKE